MARIRAILRRLERPPSGDGPLEVNGVRIDPGTRQVTVNGKPVELTTFEFDILELLMRSAGKVLSRDDLMEHLYNRKATAFDRSIDMHISHLRKKLETGPPADQDHPRRRIPVLPYAGGTGGSHRMRSLFAKILLWFLATIMVAFVGFTVIAMMNYNDPMRHAAHGCARSVFQAREASEAYEDRWRAALRWDLARVKEIFQADAMLTDAQRPRSC